MGLGLGPTTVFTGWRSGRTTSFSPGNGVCLSGKAHACVHMPWVPVPTNPAHNPSSKDGQLRTPSMWKSGYQNNPSVSRDPIPGAEWHISTLRSDSHTVTRFSLGQALSKPFITSTPSNPQDATAKHYCFIQTWIHDLVCKNNVAKILISSKSRVNHMTRYMSITNMQYHFGV